MPRIKKTLTKSERKMVDDLFKAACKDHNNPTTAANNGANDDSKSKQEDTPAANDALSANQPDEVVSANATEKEDPTSSDEEDELLGQRVYNTSRTAQLRREQRQENMEEEEELAPQQHTVAKPPVIHIPSNYNDEVRKRKSSSGISDREMESTPKKKHIQISFAQRMDDLRVYKEKHGHVNVKQSDDKNLSDFCKRMKHARNHPEKSSYLVNDDRIAS